MKTVRSVADATKLAALTGGTLQLGDRTINAAGGKLALAPAVKPQPAPPPPAPIEPGLTEADVRRLIDERESVWRAHSDAQQRQIDLLTAMLQVRREPPTYRLQATYDDEDRLIEAVVTPEA